MKIKGSSIYLIRAILILSVIIVMTGCRTMTDYAYIAKTDTDKGQHDEAIQNARQGIALNPQYAPNWYWMGIAYYKKRNYDEAINAFKKVVELRPDGAQLESSYYHLGWAYLLKGNHAESISNFNRAIELKPADSDSLNSRGLVYNAKGNYDEAIKDFNKAIELKPANRDFFENRGRAYYAKGNYDEAIKDFNKAIELEPANIDPILFRGWSYYYKGDFNSAIKDFNRAIENIKPEHKQAMQFALRGKAFSYLGLGDVETAISLVQQAKSVSSYNNNYDLALIYYVAGNKDKAWEFRGGKGALGMSVRDYKKGGINGADVDKAMPGGPAEKAGIIAGDVIIKLNNAQISDMDDFLRMIRLLEPGTTAKIKILREGIEKDINVEVAYADFLMEIDHLVAPIMAKRKGDSGVKALKEPTFISYKKSDVDDPPVIMSEPVKNAYAIVIGIEDYRQKLPKADFAAQDAKLVADYLVKAMGYPEENVILLINDKALQSDLNKYFDKWLPNNVEKDSIVFVYYSGHGAPDPKTGGAYLVPYDGDPSFIAETGYSLKRMYDALGKLPAKEIVVALDSCFSGAGGRSVIAKGARPLVMNISGSLALSKNMTVLSASSGEQISSTYDEKGHGLFTYFMLKGIKNESVIKPDGSIKMDDLFGYIKPQVERIARKQYNNEQTPQLITPRSN